MVEVDETQQVLRGGHLRRRLGRVVLLWFPVIGTVGLLSAGSLVMLGMVDIDDLLMRVNRDPSPCVIKGDIDHSGEQIYYLPSMAEYDHVMISTSRGERWFCTEIEAKAAGWRLPFGAEPNR